MAPHGTVIVLNGAPRSGKSSIAAALLARRTDWVADGVDADMALTPDGHLPGIGLRPGGERPDLEPIVEARFHALYDRVAATSRSGIGVVVDVGHHDDYSSSLETLTIAAAALIGLPAWLIGVRCPLATILERRASDGYPTDGPAIERWQSAVHDPGIYDLEVDTSVAIPADSAARILDHIDRNLPSAWARLRPEA